jgi:hypothetical protein
MCSGNLIVLEAYCDVCKYGHQWTGKNTATFPGYRHCGKLEPTPADMLGAPRPVETEAAAAPRRITWV